MQACPGNVFLFAGREKKMAAYERIYMDDLPQRAIALWLYLSRRANKDGQCWPGINRIARELHMSRSTVKRAIDDLEASHWLTTEQRWRKNGASTTMLFTLHKQ